MADWDGWLRGALDQYGGDHTWKHKCVQHLQNAIHTENQTIISDVIGGLVGQMGHSVSDTADVWGINMETCYQYCSYEELGTVFDFSAFSAGATNYLLPWLALTAQLPFETGEYEVMPNIMSFCYALGSPLLITFSLMITILNQHWLRNKFRHLESSDRPIHNTVKNARQFLQESQQLPLRLSQEGGSLASLIVLPENADWWDKLKTSIQITRRGVTLSLVAQILVAIISWVLTVMASFFTALGNPTDALVLSSGSLWVWLVPVICGWIAVGTQRDYGTIERALKRDMANVIGTSGAPGPIVNPFLPVDGQIRRDTLADGFVDEPRPTISVRRPSDLDDIRPTPSPSEKTAIRPHTPQDGKVIHLAVEKQKAFQIVQEHSLMRPLARDQAVYGALELRPDATIVPNCLGFSVAGDEKQEGPTFNYARMFTWWNMANRLRHSFEITTEHLEKRVDINGKLVPKDAKFKQRNLKGDCLSLSRYCGLAHTDHNGVIEPIDLHEYPAWRELDSAFYQRILVAVLVGLFVQWGTTGAAIIISYLTEVRGLGCRSGSYTIYGTIGTIAFVMLFASSLLSHAAMLRHEAMQRRARDGGSFPDEPTPSPTGFGVLAVVTRVTGRVLVVVNTIWIILISLWELIGFFNNCWCDGTAISKGMRGWIILFKPASAMAGDAQSPWAGGVFLSGFVGAAGCAIFWLYCRGNRS